MKKFEDFCEKNFLIFIVYSVIGWIYEVMWFLIVKDKFVNRGFLFGPYLPVYGFGALILYHILKKFIKKKHMIKKIDVTPLIILVAVFVIATTVEYVAHYVLDEYFHIILWNYSKNPLNINGRVCFDASKNFAIGGTLALYIVQPLVDKIHDKLGNKRSYKIFLATLFIVVMIDLCFRIF